MDNVVNGPWNDSTMPVMAKVEGKFYVARHPKIKTIAKDGEVVISGFYEITKEVEHDRE